MNGTIRNTQPVAGRILRFFAASVVGGLLAITAQAAADASDAYKELESKLAAALSENAGSAIKVDAVKKTPASALLEVTLENGLVLYATEDGSHFVVGDLYAVKQSGLVNLAEERRATDRKVLIDEIEVDQMIVFSPSDAPRDYITVFTDVTCFYCQKLHREVDDLNSRGIEVRYLAYPRGGMNSDGAKQLATAWCADDPQSTLTKLKSGVTLPSNVCDEAPVEAQFRLGGRLGVSGTPAIVTSSGQMIPGYKSADDLEQILGLK